MPQLVLHIVVFYEIQIMIAANILLVLLIFMIPSSTGESGYFHAKYNTAVRNTGCPVIIGQVERALEEDCLLLCFAYKDCLSVLFIDNTCIFYGPFMLSESDLRTQTGAALFTKTRFGNLYIF